MNHIPIYQLTEDEKRAQCPRIVLRGWWWKQFVPHYRRVSEAVNELAMHDWMNGGYEKHIEAMHQMFLEMHDRARMRIDADLFETLNRRPTPYGRGLKLNEIYPDLFPDK